MVETSLHSQFDHLGFRVAYNGSAFFGFQTQKNENSVQSELERVFKTVLKFENRIHFTSRTDAGVHARDQWVILPHAYPLWEKLPSSMKARLRVGINALLREQASIWDAMRVNASFKTKTHVKWKEYTYLVMEGRSPVPYWSQSHWAIRSKLDLNAIKKSLRLLEGEYDFKSFSNQSRSSLEKKSTIRNLMQARVEVLDHPFGNEHRILKFKFRANGFLYHMVRNIMGAMIEIGLGKKSSVVSLMKRSDFFAGVKAPAYGLTLAETFIEKKWYKTLNDF